MEPWTKHLLPKQVQYVKGGKIDERWIKGGIDLATVKTTEKDNVTTNNQVIYSWWSYTESQLQDAQLWEYFREDFRDWTEEIWGTVNPFLIREFRDFLRENGVWVAKDGAPIARNFQRLLEEEKQHVWTEKDITL
jgi:hypothetical protein